MDGRVDGTEPMRLLLQLSDYYPFALLQVLLLLLLLTSLDLMEWWDRTPMEHGGLRFLLAVFVLLYRLADGWNGGWGLLYTSTLLASLASSWLDAISTTCEIRRQGHQQYRILFLRLPVPVSPSLAPRPPYEDMYTVYLVIGLMGQVGMSPHDW